jgi:hypothetical protein
MPGVITTTNAAVDAPQFVAVHPNDPLASPLIEELAVVYSTQYGGSAGQKCSELRACPAEEFEPPGGALIVAISKGVPVAGGAFRQYDSIYLAMGYTPLYGLSLPARDIGPHPFEKQLVCEGAA